MQLAGDPIELDETSALLYCEQYLTAAQADTLLEFCTEQIAWTQSRIMMFGKRVPIPRLNAWYGELPYRYSGTTFEASLPPAPLQTLQAQINRDTGWQLNSVLANLYRNGLDHMGWHSDDEQSLGSTPQIASLSLGAQRRFVLRNKKDRSNKHQLNLHHGSLLLMLGRCQRDWQHHLPKSTRLALPRINLTFRESVRH